MLLGEHGDGAGLPVRLAMDETKPGASLHMAWHRLR
jgi:hypothetical protein